MPAPSEGSEPAPGRFLLQARASSLVSASTGQFLGYCRLLVGIGLLCFVIAALAVPGNGPITVPVLVLVVLLLVASLIGLLLPEDLQVARALSALADLLVIIAIAGISTLPSGRVLLLLLAIPVASAAWTLRLVGAIVAPLTAGISFALLSAPPTQAPRLVVTLVLVAVLAVVAGAALLTAARQDLQSELLSLQARLAAGSSVRASQQELIARELFDAVDVAILAVDDEGEIVMANQAMSRLQSAMGMESMLDVSHHPSFRSDGITPWPADGSPMDSFLRGTELSEVVEWVRLAEGTLVALEVTIRIVRSPDGGVRLRAAFLADVTAKMTVESAWRQTIAHGVGRTMEIGERFVTRIQSDLDRGAVTPQRVEIVAEMSRQVQEILSGLTQLSQDIVSGPNGQSHDLNEAFIRVIQRRQEVAARRGIVFVERLAEPVVVAQSGTLVQVVARYAINFALAAAENGSEIRVTTVAAGPGFDITVTPIDETAGPGAAEGFEISELHRLVVGIGGALSVTVGGGSATVSGRFPASDIEEEDA